MAASTNDKITDVRNAARPNSARVSVARAAAATTLNCDNLTGWPTASKVHFVTYEIDSNSNPVAGTQLDCSGIVSGNNIGSLTVIDGTDTGNAVGDVVEMLPTAAWGQDLADALTLAHDRTGAHASAATYPNPNFTGTVTGTATYSSPTLTTPTIASFTNATHNHTNAAGGGQLTGSSSITAGTINYANLLTTIFSGQVNTYSPGSLGGSGYYINLGGIKMAWGNTAGSSGVAYGYTINMPSSFFSTMHTAQVQVNPNTNVATAANIASVATTAITGYVYRTDSPSSNAIFNALYYWAIGT